MKTHSTAAVIVFLLSLSACEKKHAVFSAPYKVDKGEIIFTDNSPFLKHLEILPVQTTNSASASLRAVGQMIVIANAPSELTGSKISWLELDPELSKSVGLDIKSYTASSVGTAFGVTSVPSEYANKIHVGESVEVSRYGLQKSGSVATIVKVHSNNNADRSYVIFQMKKGQDWYPGTNCQVKFPLLQTLAVEVPTTAILHEGQHEYALKQLSPLHFKLVPISIIDESPEKAQVIGLNPQDFVIGSGAILLKPELHNFIQEQKEGGHALQ